MEYPFFYKIKNKIILMILLASVPCILFSVYSSNKYYSYSLNTIIEEKEALVEEMTQNLDFQLEYYENITLTMYYNGTILDYINNENYTSDDKNISSFLQGIVNSESNVESVVLELEDSRYVVGYNYHYLDSYLEKHRDRVLDKRGKIVWFPTETMAAQSHANLKTFSAARAVNSKEGTVGTLWMFFPSELIADILQYERVKQEGIDYYILTDDNMVVCSSREKMDGEYVTDEELLASLELGTSGENHKSMKNIVVSKRSEVTGWRTTIVVDTDIVFKPVEAIQRTTWLLMMLSVFVLVLIYFFMTRTIFEPMNHLSLGMKQVSKKQFEKITAKNKEDEMGMLITNYNFMIDEIKRLMLEVREEEKEKNEEKMKVLSMQISPHFVFNTLNTVKWMAISNKQTNIKCMIESLIDLMKSVTYTKKDEITIAEELSLLESYVYIQKMRFVNFEFYYEVQEETKEFRILKLLLQPLVENCIQHAFLGRRQGGVINLRIYREDEVLHIFVEDNGVGFEVEEKQDIWLENTKESPEHVGIYNVLERIQLTYGKGYTAEIDSIVGEGTSVHLILPVLRNAHEEEI